MQPQLKLQLLQVQLPTIDTRISFILAFNGVLLIPEGYAIIYLAKDILLCVLYILLALTVASIILCTIGNMPGDFLLKLFRKPINKKTLEETVTMLDNVTNIKLRFFKIASFLTIATLAIILIGLILRALRPDVLQVSSILNIT